MDEVLAQARSLLLDPDALVRAVGSGRAAGRSPRWRRVELRPVELKAGRRLQVTSYTATQAFTANHEWSRAGAVVDELLGEGYADWAVQARDRTARLRAAKGGRLTGRVEVSDEPVEPMVSHDRAKDRLLPVGHPALRALGLTTAEGRPRAGKQDKLRQVDEFLRLLGAAIDDAGLALSDPLRVVDLGCGNAYLTVAAHAFLTARGIPVRMLGVDVREQARSHNEAIARELDCSDTLRFEAATIDAATMDSLGGPPDVVLALHACDTATDDALAAGVRSGARLILAAPCCHHDIQRQLTARSAPAPHPALVRHGILRERWGDVLTDAVRADLLRLLGFRVDVVEFIGSEHTPRNVMLRAVRTGVAASADRWREYDTLVGEWGVTPALSALLAPELAAARAAACGEDAT